MVECRRVTWCDWSASCKSPKTIESFTRAVVATARAERCLFARKFPAGALGDEAGNVAVWEAALLDDAPLDVAPLGNALDGASPPADAPAAPISTVDAPAAPIATAPEDRNDDDSIADDGPSGDDEAAGHPRAKKPRTT